MLEGNLREYLVTDILSRLPVKSLLRFKCVHRSWCSLLKSSYFIITHLQNPKNKGHGFIFVLYLERFDDHSGHRFGMRLLAPDTFDIYLDDQTPFYKQVFGIAGSCNGLVCLEGFYQFHGRVPMVYLCNPPLKQHKIITESTLSNHPNNIHHMSQVFGFGYDSRNNDYKVVRVHSLRDEEGIRRHAEMFSLGTNSWRNVGMLPDDITFSCFEDRCFFNGAIHKLAIKQSISNSKADLIIFRFDICSEVFEQFPLPIPLQERESPWSKTKRIHVYGDLLCIIDFHPHDPNYSDKNHISCTIWVMKEYGDEESWTRQPCISLFSSNPIRFPYSFLGFGMKGEMIFLEDHYKGGLIVDYPNKEGGPIVDYPDKEKSKYVEFKEKFKYVDFKPTVTWKTAVACAESLVSLE